MALTKAEYQARWREKKKRLGRERVVESHAVRFIALIETMVMIIGPRRRTQAEEDWRIDAGRLLRDVREGRYGDHYQINYVRDAMEDARKYDEAKEEVSELPEEEPVLSDGV